MSTGGISQASKAVQLRLKFVWQTFVRLAKEISKIHLHLYLYVTDILWQEFLLIVCITVAGGQS